MPGEESRFVATTFPPAWPPGASVNAAGVAVHATAVAGRVVCIAAFAAARAAARWAGVSLGRDGAAVEPTSAGVSAASWS